MAIGTLEVSLVRAKGLVDKDTFGNMDPYVLVKFKGQERKSTVAQDAGGSPSWNEKFQFRAEYPGNGHQSKLTFTIMDEDTFREDDFVGQATIFIDDLLALGVEQGSAQLHPTKYRVVGADESYCGEIIVGVSFTLKNEDNFGQELGGWRQSEF